MFTGGVYSPGATKNAYTPQSIVGTAYRQGVHVQCDDIAGQAPHGACGDLQPAHRQQIHLHPSDRPVWTFSYAGTLPGFLCRARGVDSFCRISDQNIVCAGQCFAQRLPAELMVILRSKFISVTPSNYTHCSAMARAIPGKVLLLILLRVSSDRSMKRFGYQTGAL